jgi:hypothetical protein
MGRQIIWLTERLMLLVTATVKHRAHLKERKRKGCPVKSLEEKWLQVALELSTHKDFEMYLPLCGDNLKKRYGRLKSDILQKYGISQEGANLSALEFEPDDADKFPALDRLVLDMVAEEEQYQILLEEEDNKERRTIAEMDHAEDEVISRSFHSPQDDSSMSGNDQQNSSMQNRKRKHSYDSVNDLQSTFRETLSDFMSFEVEKNKSNNAIEMKQDRLIDLTKELKDTIKENQESLIEVTERLHSSITAFNASLGTLTSLIERKL